MDQDEMDELLYRLDERTERIDNRLGRVTAEVARNERKINEIQSQVQSNTKSIGLAKKIIVGIGGVISAVAAKIITGIRLL